MTKLIQLNKKEPADLLFFLRLGVGTVLFKAFNDRLRFRRGFGDLPLLRTLHGRPLSSG